MFATQMSPEFVFIQKSELAVLANRMSLVTLVIGISNSSVSGEIASVVASTLRREDFQVVRANLAVVELVVLSDVILQFVELHKRLVVALWAAVLE
jgi:hypothetical protein